MNKYVLDASALLALMNKEIGHELVAEVVTYSIMSTVNVSEALVILQRHAIEPAAARLFINDMLAEIITFDEEQAFIAAVIHKQTYKFGLSLGDRSCLSLAKKLQLPVLTADKAWSNVKIGVPVKLIR